VRPDFGARPRVHVLRTSDVPGTLGRPENSPLFLDTPKPTLKLHIAIKHGITDTEILFYSPKKTMAFLKTNSMLDDGNESLTYKDDQSTSIQPNVVADKVWVVVKVWRGLPVLAEVYDNHMQATQRSHRLLHTCNPLDDEVGVFEAEVNIPQRRYKLP
jgi:hypothetical protein